jgi:hypothetical protein
MQSLQHLCAPRRDVHHYAPEESMPVVTSSCGTHGQVLALIDTHRHIVSLILCAGTIFGCCNSSCIDVSNIVIQVMQEYLLGWALARMRISISRIAFRLTKSQFTGASMFVLSQYTREILFLIIASCVHCAHAMDEASPEYTKLLNVEIWDSVPSPYFRLSSG